MKTESRFCFGAVVMFADVRSPAEATECYIVVDTDPRDAGPLHVTPADRVFDTWRFRGIATFDAREMKVVGYLDPESLPANMGAM